MIGQLGGGGGDLLQHPPPRLSGDDRWNRRIGGGVGVGVGVGVDTVGLHVVDESFNGRELLREVSQASFESVELLVEVV